MAFNYTELNENILYLAENLNFIEKDFKKAHNCCLADLQSESHLLILASKEITRVIKSCLRSRNLSQTIADSVKSNIFTFMLKRYVGEVLIVPSPKLSFELIIHLAIQNELHNILNIFKNEIGHLEIILNEDLSEYLLELLNFMNLSNHYIQPTMLFAIGVLCQYIQKTEYIKKIDKMHSYAFLYTNCTLYNQAFDELAHQIFKILEETWVEPVFGLVNTEKIINSILIQIHTILSNSLEEHKNEKIDLFVKFLYFLTGEYSNFLIKIHNKNLTLELLSLLHTKIDRDNGYSKLADFYNYLIDLVEKNFLVKFNEYFIIINKLTGYEEFFKKVVLSKKCGDLSLEDLECLQNCMEQLKNEQEVYFLLKNLDSPLTSQSVVSGLTQIFWSLFDKLDPKSGINLIFRMYDSNELRLTNDGSIFCLDTADMRSNLEVGIKQISFANCDDPMIIKKLTGYMCVYLRNVVTKILTNALNNKSQIPTAVKIFRKFNVLLECKLSQADKDCAGRSLLIDCMKSQLKSIFENHNEKMIHNYSKLMVDISREPRLYTPDDYFSNVLKENLSFVDILSSQFRFEHAYDLYEIIYKTFPVRVTHLAFFLQILNALKFSKLNLHSSALMKLKEKTVCMIRFVVNKLCQFPVSEDETNWLRKQAQSIFWPFSTLISSATGEIFFPLSFKTLMEKDVFYEKSRLKINYFSCDDVDETDSSQMIRDILELVSINPGFNRLLNHLKNTEHTLLLKETIQIVTQPRSFEEFFNVFRGLIIIFDLDNDNCTAELLDVSNKNQGYVRFSNFISEAIFILHTEVNTTIFMAALVSFLKEYCLKNEDILLDKITVTANFLIRLYFVLSIDETQEISKFLVEILNHTLRVKRIHSKLLNVSQTILVQNSLRYLSLIEENVNKNYKYLLKQNLESLIDNLKT